jgi:imidazolonepropionase-like amidohydrolase
MRRQFLNTAGAAIAALCLIALPAAAETVAVVNARILTVGAAGEIANGTVVVRDGKIVSVGAGASAPAGARIIDAKGGVVTPGLFDAATTLGLIENSSVPQTDDSATHNSELSAAFDVQYGLDPDSVALPVERLGGITRAIVLPGYGEVEGRELMFAGQAAAIHLGAGTDILVKPRVGMVIDLAADGAQRSGGSRGGAFTAMRAALGDVRFYMRNKAGYDRGDARALGLSRADLEALIPVVEGRMPLIVTVHRAADIRQVLTLAREEGLKVILEGAEEAWRVAPEIARAGVGVIINPTADLPNNFEQRAATLENAARLNAAGVLVAFEGNDRVHRARELRYNAGIAVANGMPYAAALAAITANPARIFGLSDRTGALEPGRDGDLVVWNGDPFEPMTQPIAIFVRGAEQPLTSRAIELRDRYEGEPGPLPRAYNR